MGRWALRTVSLRPANTSTYVRTTEFALLNAAFFGSVEGSVPEGLPKLDPGTELKLANSEFRALILRVRRSWNAYACTDYCTTTCTDTAKNHVSSISMMFSIVFDYVTC